MRRQDVKTRGEKIEKGGSPIFHPDSKTLVADHQQLSSAICAAANFIHARHLIVRWSS
jgi:hypothetical protein